MFEKMNVISGSPGAGGKYPIQTGFGWSNGVILDIWMPVSCTETVFMSCNHFWNYSCLNDANLINIISNNSLKYKLLLLQESTVLNCITFTWHFPTVIVYSFILTVTCLSFIIEREFCWRDFINLFKISKVVTSGECVKILSFNGYWEFLCL